MADSIKFKRGAKAKLPSLNYGEPAFVSDEKELYIGTESGNIKLTSKSEIEELKKKDTELSSQLEQIDNKKANETDVKVLSERMNQFTSLAQGSTTGDAELADGRVDDLGIKHSNIGSAFRERTKRVIQDISDVRLNLFNIDSSLWENGNINSDGSLVDNEWSIRTKTIIDEIKKYGVYKVRIDKTYKLKVVLYDKNNKLIYYDTNWRTEDFYLNLNENIGGYKFLVNKVSGQKMSYTEIINVNHSIVYDYISNKNDNYKIWNYGSISSGNKIPSNVRMVTDYKKIDKNRIYEVEVNSPYSIYFEFYDKDKIKVFSSEYGIKTIPLGHSAEYYRAIVKNTNNELIINTCEIEFNLKEINKNYKSRGDIIQQCTWEQGTTGSNGEEKASIIRLRTRPYKLSSECFYRVVFSKSEYAICAELYDNNLNHLQPITYHTNNFYIDGFDGYIRFIMKNVSGGDRTMQVSEIVNCGISVFEDTDNTINCTSFEKIRVGTFNIGKFGLGSNYGYPNEDIDNAIVKWNKTLSECELDILGIQEFYNYFDKGNTKRSRKEIFNNIFATTNTGLLEQAVASNIELYNISYGMLDYSNTTKRPYMKAYFKVGNREVSFYVCHLSPSDESARSRQRTELINLLKQEKAFILTGDFNSNIISDYDDFKSAGFNLANGGIFGVFNTYLYSELPLDNIITSSNIKIGNVEKIADTITSDHNMLIADLLIAIE